MPNADIAALYKNFPVHLWVEDELTRSYLQAAWGPQGKVNLLIAGGGDGLHALVKNARAEGLRNVFALADRDFRDAGRSQWSPQRTVFWLDSFEIENFVLDPSAIANSVVNTARRTASDVEQYLRTEAQKFVWGMALGATCDWIRQLLNADFPSEGSLVSVSVAVARQRIFTTSWWTTSFPALPQGLSQSAIEGRLSLHHTEYSRYLGSDEWLARFAGKQLFGRLLSYVWTRGRPSGSAGDSSFAKAVAEQQRTTNRVPDEVTELLNLLVGVGTAQ